MTQHHQFTESQISDFQEAFGLFDRDGDGYLQASEVGVAVRSVGGVITDDEVNAMVQDVIDSHDGKADFADFLAMMASAFRKDEGPDDLLAAFEAFDRDGNGVVGVAELRHMLTRLGEKLNDEEVEEVIREADKDGTGQVNYEDFVKMITSD